MLNLQLTPQQLMLLYNLIKETLYKMNEYTDIPESNKDKAIEMLHKILEQIIYILNNNSNEKPQS
jgi:hypothetical protein